MLLVDSIMNYLFYDFFIFILVYMDALELNLFIDAT